MRVLAQIRKELRQLTRDRLAVALALLLPLIQLTLMGQSLAFIVRDLPLVVQDFDDSPASRELVETFRASQTFRIIAWPTDRKPEAAFTDNSARGALVIPRDFGRDLARGGEAPVQLLVDGSDANTARLLAGYAGGVTRSFNASHQREGGRPPMVQAAIRFWYNPSLSSKRFYGPGIFVMALSMFPPLLATLAMAREGERKTILQVYVSNISALEFLLGKIGAFMIVAFAECLLLLAFLFVFFGVRLAGDPTPFLVATLLYAFCVASFGTMIGAAIPNQAAAMQAVMFGGFLLVFMLSGLMFPLANVPIGLRWISNFVWARYYIEIVRDVFLQGGGWPANWFKVLAIAAIGGVFFTLAWRRMRPMRARGLIMNWLNRLMSPRLRALIQKELNQIKRDRRIMASLILPPILQLMLFGSVMNPSVANVNLGVLDESQSPASRDLVAALSESGSFKLMGVYQSVDVLGRDISLGTIDAGVVIPSDFARDLGRGRPSTIQVLLNAMNANTASISQGYIQGVIQSFNATRPTAVRPSITSIQGPATRRGIAVLHPALLYNPGGISTWFIVTGLLGTLLIMNGTITASTTMVKEREAGTLEQLLMTPAGMTEIIVAKIVPPFVLLAVPAVMALLVIHFYFGVPFNGSAPVLAVSSALCLLCGIGIGTAVATITKSAQQAQLATFFITPPLMSLSGAMSPAEAMPNWMRPWTALNPVYHFGVISRASLIKGAGFAELWPHITALLVFALVLMSVSVWRFRQQLT